MAIYEERCEWFYFATMFASHWNIPDLYEIFAANKKNSKTWGAMKCVDQVELLTEKGIQPIYEKMKKKDFRPTTIFQYLVALKNGFKIYFDKHPEHVKYDAEDYNIQWDRVIADAHVQQVAYLNERHLAEEEEERYASFDDVYRVFVETAHLTDFEDKAVRLILAQCLSDQGVVRVTELFESVIHSSFGLPHRLDCEFCQDPFNNNRTHKRNYFVWEDGEWYWYIYNRKNVKKARTKNRELSIEPYIKWRMLGEQDDILADLELHIGDGCSFIPLVYYMGMQAIESEAKNFRERLRKWFEYHWGEDVPLKTLSFRDLRVRFVGEKSVNMSKEDRLESARKMDHTVAMQAAIYSHKNKEKF